MVLRTNIKKDLIQALQEIEAVNEIFAQSDVVLPGLKTISVPTWRGDIAPGIVSEIALLPGLKVFVGVKTPTVATDMGDVSRVFKTRFGVWVWEYSGQIAGKTVIAVDCIVHDRERVWWSAAHVGNGRTKLIDDLCDRLRINRLKLSSKETDEEHGVEAIRHIAEWTHETAQLIAGLGPGHKAHGSRKG